MFSLTATAYPDQITLSQLGDAGIRRDTIHTLDTVHAADSRHECAYCQGRNLGTRVYRDPYGLRVWHPDCFVTTVAEHRGRGDWLLKSASWIAGQ